jgi:hypothetical protein
MYNYTKGNKNIKEKNRSCQGLSPNNCCGVGHPKNGDYYAICLFEYLLTPFGMSNATQTFQRMMDRTTDGLEGVFAYMDDSCVSSLDRQTHLRHLEAFSVLAPNGLFINFEKCVFAAPYLEILGHMISAMGPTTLPKSNSAHPLRTSSSCNVFSA